VPPQCNIGIGHISADPCLSNFYRSQPKGALTLALEADAELRQAVWKALSSIGPETLTGEGRLYGGGLHKMESKELANVPASVVTDLLPEGSRPLVQPTMFASA
jgi:hypothetical protein